MKKLFEIIFRKKDNESFELAKEKLCLIKEFLEESQPKMIKYKEIYITEVHF